MLTSHDKLGNTGLKTGFWTEELAAPYYALSDQGVEITIASPKGGQPPIDPKSEDPSSQTDATRRMDNDEVLKDKLKNTHKLSGVKSEDFDAVFYPSAHDAAYWSRAAVTQIFQLKQFFANHDRF
ncbi:hypothetical protein [Chryseobacterium balustinum]|uniref:hypothetical protein n=1 Tax=Chryseobacterium balustinum TaxID=246 RepID=UPI003CF9237B